jgi:hypothetical protein
VLGVVINHIFKDYCNPSLYRKLGTRLNWGMTAQVTILGLVHPMLKAPSPPIIFIQQGSFLVLKINRQEPQNEHIL